jgi:hypothetical protein
VLIVGRLGGCSSPHTPALESRWVEGWGDGDGLSETTLSGFREGGRGPRWFAEGFKSHVIITWTLGFGF